MPLQTSERGVQQFINNITVEGLLRVDQKGTPDAWLADAWNVTGDGTLLKVHLRPNAMFHDGSHVDANAVAGILKTSLPGALRSVYSDVESIRSSGADEVEIRLRKPSRFVAESLVDVPIQKGGNPVIGTGPFHAAPSRAASGGAAKLSANERYYLGAPSIREIGVNSYPNIRSAWAALLRDDIDMLYEVSYEALDITAGKNVGLYEFERPYQYLVLLNPKSPKLRNPDVRRALNLAIDRDEIVRDGLRKHGVASVGPVSPRHWAFQNMASNFRFDPTAAAATLKPANLSITCLTLSYAPFDRLALLVKQQLAAVGVNVEINEITPDQLPKAIGGRDFEAILIEVLSGWNMFRPYRWWDSKGDLNVGYSNAAVDAAFDTIRRAIDDPPYESGVRALQRAVSEDPPAIFLAWGSRSRAVSTKFDVQQQGGLDIIVTMRTWRPASADKKAITN